MHSETISTNSVVNMLFKTCKKGDIDKITNLIRNKTLIDARDRNGQTLLMFAIRINKLEIANSTRS